MSTPGPEDVAEALRQGRPPSELLDERADPADVGDAADPGGATPPEAPGSSAPVGADTAAAPGTGPGAGPGDPATAS